MSWKVTRTKLLAKTPVFSLREEQKQRDSEDRVHLFYSLECVDWVNVVPVTAEGEIVFIELYRHGTGEISLEIPGGMIDPEDEDPMAAAAREMREETGYESDELVSLGFVHPNPAIQANRCHTFVAENARPVQAPHPDETEEIRVVLHPRRDVPRLLREGRITHALVVAALLWYFQKVGNVP